VDKALRIGQETLRKLDKLTIHNQWFWDKIKDDIGSRVLEIGCGIGIYTSFLIDSSELLVSVDIVEDYIKEVESKFTDNRNFKAIRLDIAKDDINYLTSFGFDTIVCLNVLEHIEDDTKALKNMYALLNNPGRLILLVPALHWLYGTLDQSVGHWRRYHCRELKHKIETAGFTVKRRLFCNFFGIFGWFVNGKILRREILSDCLLEFFNKFSSLLLLSDRLFSPFIGMSLLLICEKKEINK